MTITTTITYKALTAISLFTSKDGGRFNLSGINLEVLPTETRLVATDGNNLAIYRYTGQTNAETCSVLLPVLSVKQVNSILPPKYYRVSGNDKIDVIIDGQTVHFCHGTHAAATTQALEGRFPDYMRILSTEVSGISACYMPESLVVFAKAAQALTGKKGKFYETCRLYQNGGQNPGLVEIIDDLNFTGVVMCKANISTDQKPTLWWLDKS